MNVLFVTSGDRTVASSRLRVYELIPYLEQAGISVSTIPLPDHNGSVDEIYKKSMFASLVFFGAMRNDVVYLQKVRLPVWYTKLLSVISSTMIYDFDDAIYRASPGMSVDKENIRRVNMAIEQSDLTVAGSRNLSSYAQQYSNDVECLHTGIPREKYKKYRSSGITDPESILLGWIGNSENLNYIDNIEQQLDQVLEQHDNLRLRIITETDPPARPLDHREGNDVEYVEWGLDSALRDLTEADVGIRPLKDDEWTRSKGGFTSVIECFALGIPVVASPVGLVAHLIEDGENGYLADGPDRWASVLSMIAAEPEQTDSMRQEAIETVSTYEFWSQDTAAKFIDIFERVSN